VPFMIGDKSKTINRSFLSLTETIRKQLSNGKEEKLETQEKVAIGGR